MGISTDLTTISNVTVASALSRASKILIGPNIVTGDWTPEMVWNTGFVDDYQSNLAALAVQQYVILFTLVTPPHLYFQLSCQQLPCQIGSGRKCQRSGRF